jgi:hypothetical protein
MTVPPLPALEKTKLKSGAALVVFLIGFNNQTGRISTFLMARIAWGEPAINFGLTTNLQHKT